MAAKTKLRKKLQKKTRSSKVSALVTAKPGLSEKWFEVPDSVTKSDWDVVNRSASGWCVEGWGLRWICYSRETAVKVQALLEQIEHMPDRVDVENLDQGQG